jgi:hypothetical protein
MKFEASVAVRMMFVLWVVTLCRLMGRYQRFEEAYCLLLQDSMKKETVFFSEMFGTNLWLYKVLKTYRKTSLVLAVQKLLNNYQLFLLIWHKCQIIKIHKHEVLERTNSLTFLTLFNNAVSIAASMYR